MPRWYRPFGLSHANLGVFFVSMLYNANNEENEVLKFWSENHIFEKSVAEKPADKPYVFYDGPPFATGTPHYGHFVSSLMKDVVPRFWTMKGYRVERRWGWDCHGLPIENIVEKELGTKTKKEIEAMGVAKFNELCRSKVLGYVEDWKKTITRLGRWVDFDNAYRTMDKEYMESVWWVFKQLWDKGLIYEDYRSMYICPRCETTLSQQEVSEGYKDVKDISLYVKFALKKFPLEFIQQIPNELDRKFIVENPTYIVAWTTTPWTLPGNVLLAVNPGVEYVLVCLPNVNGIEGQDPYNINIIIAKKIFEAWKKDPVNSPLQEYFKGTLRSVGDQEVNGELIGHHGHSVIAGFNGSDLAGLQYEPLFPYYKDTPNAFRIVSADFVTTEDGSGVVHIAPAFGDDDFKVGKREGLTLVQHVGMDGRFKPNITDFAGQEVKPRSDDDKVRLASDIAITKYLQEKGSFLAKKNIVHSYPHCWRCDSPLINYATSSWFVKVTAVKEKALELAKEINWSPEHIKEGRFGKWLEGARDWSISRQRFWASVMPIWKCEGKENGERKIEKKCENVVVFGSAAELEKVSGQKVDDLHKHIVDAITFACEKCNGTMKRIPDVLDTWFDSGSMPYAQVHYPFENKEKFEGSFPAEFIAEGQDQTRAWFYYLHVLATSLFDKPAFKNVIVNGIVLAEDGKKMSKKLQNYPDPTMVLEKYGADAMRFYLVSSPVMAAESLNFSEDSVKETYGKLVNTLWNVFEFYQLFAKDLPHKMPFKSAHVLDRWIMAKLHETVREVTEHMEGYRLPEASRPILDFVTELSQWYVRRSRERVKGADELDKHHALYTLREVLLVLSKLVAPFTPFIAEKLYQELKQEEEGGKAWAKESVHLEHWPRLHDEHHDQSVIEEMLVARKIVEMGLALRAESGIKVRQPLGTLAINNEHLSKELHTMIAEELNVKTIDICEVVEGDGWKLKEDGDLKVWLNTTLDEALKKEGVVRDIIRAINQLRKESRLTINDRIKLYYQTPTNFEEVWKNSADQIKAATLAADLVASDSLAEAEVKIGEEKVKLKIETI